MIAAEAFIDDDASFSIFFFLLLSADDLFWLMPLRHFQLD